jgi:L-ascorbate metabolism protein UlaG (beta-lactamase superfamily)
VADTITFAGHSTVRLELDGTTLLTDPLLRERFLHVRRHAEPAAEGLLEGVDAVLVSHLHPDHLDFPSIRHVDRGVEMVIPAGGRRMLRRRGFRNVTELRPGDRARVGAIDVIATPAVHDGRRYPVGPRVEALGFDLRAPATRVYFAGDTDLFDEMAQLGPGVDVALLPVAGWGPSVGRGHLDPRRAAQAAAMIAPRVVIPIHWGTYLRAGLERRREELLDNPPHQLMAHAHELAPRVEVRVLDPGESMSVA